MLEKNTGPDFLVVGLERSGTHWLTALLNAHPEIACFPNLAFRKASGDLREIGEIHFFNTLASLEPGTEDKYTRPIAKYAETKIKIFADLVQYLNKVPKDELYRLFIERYNQLCDSQRGHKRLVGESTPAYVFHLDFIDSFYPGIKKLCIIREPKDKIISWHFNLIRKGKKSAVQEITDEFITDYCHQRIIKEYESLLAYAGNIHCLTYEELSADPHRVISQTLDYLSAEKNEEIIKEMVKEASFKNVTAKDSGHEGRERGQQSISSHYRKGMVGDWHNHLTGKQAELVNQLVSDIRKKVFDKFKLKEITN